MENYIANTPDLIFVASDLTEMECLIIPFRKNNQQLISKFYDWFKHAEIVSFSQETFRRAARLRADFPNLKTPDALHLAAAIHHNCDEFWTNDNRLEKVESNLAKNILST
ncbi:MAG: type II toxin-antitoxin system VapC family toxin [Pyrinomonadaceae bacterium]